MRRLRAVAVLLALAISSAGAGAEEPPLRVYAAASLASVLDEIFVEFKRETGRSVIGVYAASGALARQIDAGAPADLFISAHPDWTNWLGERGALEAEAAIWAGNRLVIAAATPSARSKTPEILLTAERIAVADLRAAPAGRYAQEALRKLGLYDRLATRLIEASDARAAAAWTARGEVEFGLLYATDAAIAKLSIVATLPASSHQPIRYMLATVKRAQPGAQKLSAFLTSAKAQLVLRRFGFPPSSAASRPSE
ncbi:MAG: molybdate ABC transporter substrate-binding protein [Neomegalonema sp.]|nr:molybdate ABC transporter substrate-binding protein [Neomegalonema sp.]